MDFTTRRARYRGILAGDKCVHPGSVFDPISARIAEDLGFEVGMFAGSIASFTVLGAPDIVVLTLTEFAQQIHRICRAGDLSLMVDADHGYGNDESQELEFRLVAADDSVTIEFIDEASPFDPLTETPDPDIDAGIEERRIGGLGVYLVREMMDEVKYAREGNRNRLTLVTRL